MKKVAILIPCYNEELTIATVIQDFKLTMPEAQIYVYNNNSTDRTAEIARSYNVNVVDEFRQGKGAVVRSMFRDIDADCYLMVDGDNTYPAQDAKKVAQLVLDGKADMAVGDRLSSTYFTENKRMFHNGGNRIVRLLINLIYKGRITDIMSGCRAFNKLFVKTFPVLSNGFEIETEMSIHALDKRLLIAEIPIQYRDRPQGSESKLNTVSDGIKVLGTIFKFFKAYQPLPFFGILAGIVLAISAMLFAPVFIEYLKTGLVMRFPTLIVSMALLSAALLLVMCGLILDSIKRYANQFFELTFNNFLK